MKKSLFCFLVLVLLLAFGFSGCTPAEETVDDDGYKEVTVKMAFIQEDIPVLDPHAVSGTSAGFNVIASVFNKLVRFPPGTMDSATIEGDLAKEWSVSDDGLRWTFYLREGVQWHKGYGEVTAEDVKFSFERLLDPETGCDDRVLYDTIDYIEAEDDYAVHFYLKRPDPLFIKHMAYRFAIIVPRVAMEEHGDDFFLNLVGSGPFMFDSYLPHEKVVLVANRDYFRGNPKVDRLEYYFMPDNFSRFEAFLAGEMDVIQGEPTAVAAEILERAEREGVEVICDLLGPANSWGLTFDTGQSPFDDKRVRQAIAYAIDIDEYVDSVMDIPGLMEVPTAAGLVFLDDFFGGTADVKEYRYDPEKAGELLKEAGFPEGHGLSFTLYTIDTFIEGPGLFIQDSLAKVGVEVELVKQDFSTWLGTTIPDAVHPVQYWGLYMYPEPNRTFGIVFSDDGTRNNLVNYDRVSHKLAEVATISDTNERKAMYHEIQQIIAEDCVFIPVSAQKFTRLRHSFVDLGYEPVASLTEWYDLTEDLQIKK